MPRRKRMPDEWTTEEAARKLFPKMVVEEVHRFVEEHDKEQPKRPSHKKPIT